MLNLCLIEKITFVLQHQVLLHLLALQYYSFSEPFLCFCFLEYFDLSLKVLGRIWLARIISVPDAIASSSINFLNFFILFHLLLVIF